LSKLEAIHVNLKQVITEILGAVISGAKRLKNKNFVFHATIVMEKRKLVLSNYLKATEEILSAKCATFASNAAK